MKKAIIFTDFDLDGAGSYLLFKWQTDINYELRTTSARKFHDDFSHWLYNTDLDEYSKVIILDIDCSNHLDLVDFPKAEIYDHHSKHVLIKDQYMHAKTYIEDCTSNTKLLLKYFRNTGLKAFTKPQLLLIALVDDYDSYKLKFKDTLNLNTVFWSYSGHKLEKFAEEFYNGFTGFNKLQQNVIALYSKKYADRSNELELFVAIVMHQNKSYKFVSTFCDFAINEIANNIIKRTNADVCIVINTVNNTVNIRCKQGCDYPVDRFAEKICDGGGSTIAAGGKLTDKFAEFSKIFKPL